MVEHTVLYGIRNLDTGNLIFKYYSGDKSALIYAKRGNAEKTAANMRQYQGLNVAVEEIH